MKKLVIIPLAIFLMLAFPFSVYAASMDDVTSNVTLTYSMAFDLPLYPALSSRYIGYFTTSSNLYLICSWIYGGSYINDNANSVTIKLDLPEEADLYIGTNFFELASSDLYMYYDSSQSFSTEIFFNYEGTVFNYDENIVRTDISGSGYGEVYTNMTFSKCNNVPGGTYYITIPASHFQTVDPVNNPRCAFPICIYVDLMNAPSSIYDPWYDPNASLSENIDSINETLENAIKNATSTDAAIFYTNYANYQLDVVGRLSDEKIVQSTSVMADSMDTIIKDFNDPEKDIEYSAALGDLSDEYVDTLSAAESPEQGQYVTAVYVAKQQELTQYAIMQAGQRVKDVITDEDTSTLDEYIAAEKQIFSLLDVQEFNDTLAYHNWLYLMPGTEVAVYKLLFDFFVNDASWKYFILIPLMFSVIAVLMGTHISVRAISSNISRISGGSKGGGKK